MAALAVSSGWVRWVLRRPRRGESGVTLVAGCVEFETTFLCVHGTLHWQCPGGPLTLMAHTGGGRGAAL